MPSRLMVLSGPEFDLLRAIASGGGTDRALMGDPISRANLLQEGLIRVVDGSDVLTSRASQFLERATDKGYIASGEVDD